MSESIYPPESRSFESRGRGERREMRLPDGKTCGDCSHIQRCVAFGFSRAENIHCDFAPSRFRERGSR